jgi:hypothetical protein
MGYYCHFCNHRSHSGRISRRAECEGCGADLHICLNCMNYNPDLPDRCKEPQADRTVRQDRSNFCNFFVFRDRNLTGPLTAASDSDTTAELLDYNN